MLDIETKINKATIIKVIDRSGNYSFYCLVNPGTSEEVKALAHKDIFFSNESRKNLLIIAISDYLQTILLN